MNNDADNSNTGDENEKNWKGLFWWWQGKEELSTGPRKKEGLLTEEDQYIIESAMRLKGDLDFLHNRFDHATDTFLIDSLIYEIQATQLRYKFYLDLCKERGITWGGYG